MVLPRIIKSCLFIFLAGLSPCQAKAEKPAEAQPPPLAYVIAQGQKSETTPPYLSKGKSGLEGQYLYDHFPWAFTYYYSVTGSDALFQLVEAEFHRWPEHLNSFELSRTLSEDNFLRRLVKPLVGLVQVTGNLTLRDGLNEPTIYEFDPYLAFRWANLPWNHYVNTSFAIGEGISFVTSVPSIEKKENANKKRLLNYLMFEATFALPNNPEWQLLLRIHHRSGAFGLYRAGNSGSNDVGIGIRYLL